VVKAQIVRADGTKITIDGTSEEVAQLVSRISDAAATPNAESHVPPKTARPRNKYKATKTTAAVAKSKGPIDYIRDLISEGFFTNKRGLGDVQAKLEEGAHIYAVTTLSPALFRLVRSKELRRLKEQGRWVYVNT
jgi:hypothetical protein